MTAITVQRAAFYLDADGKCRWALDDIIDLRRVGASCHICGTPIRYVFKLYRTDGSVKPHPDVCYAPGNACAGTCHVGSECIAYLSREDILKVKATLSRIKREHNIARNKARAVLLGTFMQENRSVLLDQNWEYFGRRTILSSLDYMRREWARGADKKYMESAIQQELGKRGLKLPEKPKMVEIEASA